MTNTEKPSSLLGIQLEDRSPFADRRQVWWEGDEGDSPSLDHGHLLNTKPDLVLANLPLLSAHMKSKERATVQGSLGSSPPLHINTLPTLLLDMLVLITPARHLTRNYNINYPFVHKTTIPPLTFSFCKLTQVSNTHNTIAHQ